MKFAKWFRSALDILVRSRQLQAIEDELLRNRELWNLEVQREAMLRLQRQDLAERIKDLQAVIQDLRVRLAVAETDAMREKLAKAAAAKPRVVPDFGGPVAFQDELSTMSLEVEPEATQQEKNDAL